MEPLNPGISPKLWVLVESPLYKSVNILWAFLWETLWLNVYEWMCACISRECFQISVKWKYPMYESAIINRDILARLYRTHSFCEANHISTNSNICLHLLWQQEALTITINKYFPAIGCLNYERSLKCVNKNCPQRVEVHCYFNYLRLGQNHIY